LVRRFKLLLGVRVRIAAAERLSVVLLSYKRPRNIQKILSAVVLCDFVDEIVISNNNPEVDLGRFISIEDPRITLIPQNRRRYPSVRLELSQKARSHHVLAIDDDIFLEAEQIRGLFEHLLGQPAVPHGLGGEIFSASADPTPSTVVYKRRETPVEALLWMFAYTKDHVRRYFELLDALGIKNDELVWSEDVPLSFAGLGPPLIHDLGRVHACPSENEEGVATWRNEGFFAHRVELVKRLRELLHREPPVAA
jgi:hypothetical protein